MKIRAHERWLVSTRLCTPVSAIRYVSLLVIFGVALAGCGEGGDSGTPVDRGPVIIGAGITERALAQRVLSVKSASGETTTIAITGSGNFNDAVEGQGPYLSRLDLGNNEYLYGIGYADNNQRVRTNVHSYSDLVIRNWFASGNRNIDMEFESAGVVVLPSESEVDAILQSIVDVVALVLADYGVTDTNLLDAPVNTANTAFVLQNPVIINNSNVTIIVNDNADGNGTQTIAVGALPLDTDLTDSDTVSPSTPEDLRAIAASNTEIVLVWTPSTDNIGVAAYRIFRDGVDIGETPYPIFSEVVATGLSPVYSVVAVDGAGNVSSPSLEVIGMTELIVDTTAPPTPQSVILTPTVNSVKVSWQQSDIADVAGFRVLGALSGDSVDVRATVTSTSMTDTDVASGLEYCYQVVAVDASQNESAATALQCVTVTGVVVRSMATNARQ